MGKKKSKSETPASFTEMVFQGADPATKTESPKPAPKFTGPTIVLKDIDVKAGGVVSVTCLDNKVPLGKIQIIAIKGVDATYVYRRV